MNALQSNHSNLNGFIDKNEPKAVKDRNGFVQEETLLKITNQMFGSQASKYVDILHLLMIINRIRSNQEAQNYMRECGSLSKLSTILCGHLDENRTNLETECLVINIAGCFRKPWNYDSQTSIGFIIPSIINYFNRILESKNIPDEINLWRFLKCLIQNNEENQKIFIKNEGLKTVFETIRGILFEKDGRNEIILIKNMEILLNLISQKDFAQKVIDLNFDIMFAVELLRINNQKLAKYTFQLLNVLIVWKHSKNPPIFTSTKIRSIISRRKFHKRVIREKGKKLQERLFQLYKSIEPPDNSVRKSITPKFGKRNLDYVKMIHQAHKDSKGPYSK